MVVMRATPQGHVLALPLGNAELGVYYINHLLLSLARHHQVDGAPQSKAATLYGTYRKGRIRDASARQQGGRPGSYPMIGSSLIRANPFLRAISSQTKLHRENPGSPDAMQSDRRPIKIALKALSAMAIRSACLREP
jgi:hypothetical protein